MNQWYDELTPLLRRRGRPARRRLLRHPAADGHDLRLGLHEHGAAGQPVRPDRLRRVPPPARADLRPGSATCAIAPFRLGLTATPERADNAHDAARPAHRPDRLPSRDHPAPRPVPGRLPGRVPLYVNLSEEERFRYEAGPRSLPQLRPTNSGIDMRRPDGWSQFLFLAFRSPEGRAGLPRLPRAADAGPGRAGEAEPARPPARPPQRRPRPDLHPRQRHGLHRSPGGSWCRSSPTRPRPRSAGRSSCGSTRGRYPIVATSKVLNEGVNVPEANVAVILSRLGLGPRARPAPRPHPPQVGRQGGRALRGRHPRHRRGIHLQPPEAAQCVRRGVRKIGEHPFSPREKVPRRGG